MSDALTSAGLSKGDIDNILKPQNVSNQNKELLEGETKGDIRTRTDLDEDEIKQVALAFHYAKIVKSAKLKAMISDLLYLKVSKKRLSRKEYVDSLKQEVNNSGGGFFSNLFNKNGQ